MAAEDKPSDCVHRDVISLSAHALRLPSPNKLPDVTACRPGAGGFHEVSCGGSG